MSGQASLLVRLWFLVLAALALSGCERSYEAMAQERAAYAARAQGPIFIAVIEDQQEDRRHYVDGVRLAVQEINEAGGVLGRPLETQRYPNAETYKEMLPVIRSIAANPRISAVLGHRRSSIAVPASVVYEASELLFLSPFATDTRLTLHGFQFTLRTVPDNRVMAAQSASVGALFGYENVAVLYARDDYSRELAFLFEDAARREGMRVVFRGSFFADEVNYRTLIGRMNTVEFDAIYLAAGAEAGARALRQLREMDMRQPVIGSDNLSGDAVARATGSAGDRTMVPTIYVPGDRAPSNRAFVNAYRRKFGATPTRDAAQGYDSAHLFAEIVRQAGSTEPRVLAAKAHYIDPVAGVAGAYAYDESGDVYGKNYRFQVLRAGRWRPLAGVEAPYLLAAYRDRLARAEEEEEQEEESSGPDDSPAAPPDTIQADGSAAQAIEAAQQAAGDIAGTEDTQDDAAPIALLSNDPLGNPRVGRLTRYRAWLALAQGILSFERLGVMVPDTDEGAAFANMARSVGDRIGFGLEVCRIPAPPRTDTQDTADALRRAALRCYSRLSVRIDAMLVMTDTGLDPTYLRRLNMGLRAYQIPAFALLQEMERDYGLAMVLISAAADLDRGAQARNLDGLLKDMRFFDLSRRLAALPTVRVDLDAFEDIGKPLSLEELSVIYGTFSFDESDRAATAPLP